MTDLNQSLYVSSAEKAFIVLEAVAARRGGATLGEIAKETGLGMSAAQRFTYTLNKLGYLEKDERTKVYSIATRALRLSMSFIQGNDTLSVAESHLIKLAEETGESVNLVFLDNVQSVYVWHKSGSKLVSVNIFAGTRLPAFCTASGRAILSCLSDDEVDYILGNSKFEKLTENTIIDVEEIKRRVASIRFSGLSISNQECFEGAISIAAPLAGAKAAINLSVPVSRLEPDDAVATFSAAIRRTAKSILEDLNAFSGRHKHL